MTAHEREYVATVPSALHEAEHGADEQPIVEGVIGASEAEQDARRETTKGNAHVVVDVEAGHRRIRLFGAPVREALRVSLRQILQGLQRQDGSRKRR